MIDTTRFGHYLPSMPFSWDYALPLFIQRLHLRAKATAIWFEEMPRYPLRFDQVPPLFVEPFILRGFRAIHQPWSYYLKSLFHKHNETINVWSHLLGVLYMIHLIFYYNERLNFLGNPHAWPFAVSLCTSITMFICSAFAHLLHSKSQRIHMTCFLIDFVGVSLHGFGSGFLHIYYAAPQWYYEKIEYQYMPVLFLFAILACFLNCFAQYYFRRPYPPLKRICQFFPCGLLWIYSIIPLVIRIVSSSTPLDSILICHVAQIILFLLGAILFGCDIPQRFCPGALDFFGQGHHLFHFCIYLISILQMHATFWDYEQFQHIIDQRGKPELFFCAGSICSLIIVDIIIVCFFRRKIHSKSHRH